MSRKITLYDPQIRAGRCKTEKLEVSAGDPITIVHAFSLGDQLTISSDRKYIVVGDNIKSVKITAEVHFVANDTRYTLAIRRISSNDDAMIGNATGDGTNYTVSVVAIANVNKGDKLYMTPTADCTINPSVTGGYRTFLLVEKIA